MPRVPNAVGLLVGFARTACTYDLQHHTNTLPWQWALVLVLVGSGALALA